jgi:ribonuclease HI
MLKKAFKAQYALRTCLRFAHTSPTNDIETLRIVLANNLSRPYDIRKAITNALANDSPSEVCNILYTPTNLRILSKIDVVEFPKLLPLFSEIQNNEAEKLYFTLVEVATLRKLRGTQEKGPNYNALKSYTDALVRLTSTTNLPINMRLFNTILSHAVSQDLNAIKSLKEKSSFCTYRLFEAALSHANSGIIKLKPTYETMMTLLRFYVGFVDFTAAHDFFMNVFPVYAPHSAESYTLFMSVFSKSPEPDLDHIQDAIRMINDMPSKGIPYTVPFARLLRRIFWYTDAQDMIQETILKIEKQLQMDVSQGARMAPTIHDKISIYTDGSLKGVSAAYAVVMTNPKIILESNQLQDCTDIDFAECYAIERAAHHTQDHQSVKIYTDSLNCVRSIKEFLDDPSGLFEVPFSMLEMIRMHARRVRGFQVIWVKGHSGNVGNHLADAEATFVRKTRIKTKV